MTWFVFVLAALAAARTWRLATMDVISERWRMWMAPKLPDFWLDGYFCPFCSGFWIACAWVGSAVAWGDTWPWQLIAGCFAANYAAAQLNAWLDERPVTDAGGEIGPE